MISPKKTMPFYFVFGRFFIINQTLKVYIFDRYAHDVLIDPIRYRFNLSKKLTKFILGFFPEPDLWIYLKPSIKTIKSRKIETIP